ncbi:MAG: hypothetical protein Q4F97_08300 [Bacteroidales bacterium]|nr:hypothetical protein [Bacteroidales bacterium]
MKNRTIILKSIATFLISIFCLQLSAQKAKINYDENLIEPYVLPDILTLENGEKVTNKKVWENKEEKKYSIYSITRCMEQFLRKS